MGETLLGKLLDGFSKVDLAGLERYAVYKVENPAMLRGIQLLLTKGHHNVSADEFVSHIYTGASLETDVGRFRKMVFRIRELALEYLAVRHATRSKSSVLENAFRFMSASEWDQHLQLLSGRLERAIDAMPECLEAYSLRIELDEAVVASRIREQGEVSSEELSRGLRHIERRYLVDRLRYDCLQLDLQLQNGAASPIHFPDLSPHLPSPLFENGSLPHAYHLLRDMLRDPEDGDLFGAACQTIFECDDKATVCREERLELLQLLLNQAIRRARTGVDDYTIAKEALLRTLPAGKRDIHQRALKNAISLLILAGDVEAARKILEKFRGRIKGDGAGHAQMYNEAVVWYYEGRFAKARALFHEVIYASDDHYMKADGRIYWWRAVIDEALAEGGYDEDFIRYQGPNTKKFFSRTGDLSEDGRAFYLRFFHAIFRLYKAMGLKTAKKRQFTDSLEGEVEALEDHPLKTWLREKLDELKD